MRCNPSSVTQRPSGHSTDRCRDSIITSSSFSSCQCRKHDVTRTAFQDISAWCACWANSASTRTLKTSSSSTAHTSGEPGFTFANTFCEITNLLDRSRTQRSTQLRCQEPSYRPLAIAWQQPGFRDQCKESRMTSPMRYCDPCLGSTAGRNNRRTGGNRTAPWRKACRSSTKNRTTSSTRSSRRGHWSPLSARRTRMLAQDLKQCINCNELYITKRI